MTVELVDETEHTQDKGQEVELIPGLIVPVSIRHFIKIAQATEIVVNSANPRDPVAVLYFSLALKVILSSGIIPHEIPPPHPVDLVTKEISKVVSRSRGFIGAKS